MAQDFMKSLWRGLTLAITFSLATPFVKGLLDAWITFIPQIDIFGLGLTIHGLIAGAIVIILAELIIDMTPQLKMLKK